MVEGSVSSMCNSISQRSSTRQYMWWEYSGCGIASTCNPWCVWWLLSSSTGNPRGLPGHGANVQYNLLVAQAAVQGMCDVVECCDMLVCLFCCTDYYVDVFTCSPGWHILLMLKIEMMWTRVSCCLCCVAINWLIFVLLLLTSLVVAVPVNQQNASPRTGRRFLLICLLETKTPLNEGFFFKNWVAARISDL